MGALPKSWVQGVHPKEESAPEIDHSAAAAAAQDLMDQLDTSDEVEESMHNLETPALKTREYNPVDPPYGQDPKPYNPNAEPYNPDPKPYGQAVSITRNCASWPKRILARLALLT